MITLIYNAPDRVIKIKITGKIVEYSDSIDHKEYILFENLIKGVELNKWLEKVTSLDTEEDISKEIKHDLGKQGFSLIKELKNV